MLIFCMYYYLWVQGKEVVLYYCVCFCKEVVFIVQLLGQLGVSSYFDDEVGIVLNLCVVLGVYLKELYFYCCGLIFMFNVFESLCEELGLFNVYIECFVVEKVVFV